MVEESVLHSSIIIRLDEPRSSLQGRFKDDSHTADDKSQWTSNQIQFLRSLLPRVVKTTGSFKLDYNITSLGNAWHKDKVDIYHKIIELYNEKSDVTTGIMKHDLPHTSETIIQPKDIKLPSGQKKQKSLLETLNQLKISDDQSECQSIKEPSDGSSNEESEPGNTTDDINYNPKLDDSSESGDLNIFDITSASAILHGSRIIRRKTGEKAISKQADGLVPPRE